jgi:hypothetical protein
LNSPGARLKEASEHLVRRTGDIDLYLKLFVERSDHVAKVEHQQLLANQISDDAVTPLRVFISYSRIDLHYADELGPDKIVIGGRVFQSGINTDVTIMVGASAPEKCRASQVPSRGDVCLFGKRASSIAVDRVVLFGLHPGDPR